MSVGQSIPLKTLKFLTLFVALVRTIDAGGTSGGLNESETLCSNQRNIRKTSRK